MRWYQNECHWIETCIDQLSSWAVCQLWVTRTWYAKRRTQKESKIFLGCWLLMGRETYGPPVLIPERHPFLAHMCRVGQNRIYTVYLVISKPKIPYVHRIYMVLANPTHVGKRPLLLVSCSSVCRWLHLLFFHVLFSHVIWEQRVDTKHICVAWVSPANLDLCYSNSHTSMCIQTLSHLHTHKLTRTRIGCTVGANELWTSQWKSTLMPSWVKPIASSSPRCVLVALVWECMPTVRNVVC